VATKSPEEATKQKILDLPNAISEQDDCDVMLQILGSDVIIPRHGTRKEPPKLEYLNAESTRIAEAKSSAKGGGRRDSRKKSNRGRS
jgi:hypothetical protein